MVLVKVVTTVSDQLKAQGPTGLDYEGQCLLQYCSVQSELLQAYNNLQKLQGKPVEGESEVKVEISEDVSERLTDLFVKIMCIRALTLTQVK